MSDKSLKSGLTAVFIVPYVIAALVVVAVFSFPELLLLSFTSIATALEQIPGAALSILSAATFLFSILVQHLLPAPAKEVVVFWRWHNRLPGYRAFSDLAHRDGRIDVTKIESLGGKPDLPPADQNKLWYRLYKGVADAPSVTQSHRRYLGFRDLAAVVALTAPPLTIFALFMEPGWPSIGLVLAFFSGFYFSAVIAARNAAHEFVRNVLALQ